MISSSIVMQDPPALVILARAVSVKRRAATSSLGTSKVLMSSVTVPTTTQVRDLKISVLVSLVRIKRFHLRLVSEMSDHLAERHGRSHGPGSDQSPEDGLAEA